MRFLIELLLVTAAALWIGGTRFRVRALIISDIVLAIMAWLVRCALIFIAPEDITTSEDYFNGLTVWIGATEIGLITLWALAWSYTGMIVAKHRQRNVNDC